MAIPLKIKPNKIDDYFEIMSKAIFQAGLSWAAIDKRWTSFISAFAEFDPNKVSKFSEKQILQLSDDKSLLLNKRKLEAIIHNAKIIVALDKEYAGFANYLHAFKDYETLACDLKRRFKYLGDMNVYYFLFRTSEPVPLFKKWIKTIPGDHPRMKEMIEAADIKKCDNDFGDAINKHG